MGKLLDDSPSENYRNYYNGSMAEIMKMNYLKYIYFRILYLNSLLDNILRVLLENVTL